MFLILRLPLLAFLMVLCNAEVPKQDVVPEVPDQDSLSSSPMKDNSTDETTSGNNSDKSLFTDESLHPKERAKRAWNYLQNLAIDSLIKRERDVKEAIKCVIGLDCNLPTVFKTMLQDQGAQVLLYGHCLPVGSCSATTESMALIFRRRVRQMYPELYKSTIQFLTDLENSEDDYVDSADYAYDYYYEDEGRSFKSEQNSSDIEETLFTVKDDVERGRSYEDDAVHPLSRTYGKLSDKFRSAVARRPGVYKVNYRPSQTYRREVNGYVPVYYRQSPYNQRGLRVNNRRNLNSPRNPFNVQYP